MRRPVGVTRNFLADADLIGREWEYQRFHRRAGQQVERRDHDPFLKARIVGLAERVPQRPVHRKDKRSAGTGMDPRGGSTRLVMSSRSAYYRQPDG